MQFLRAVAIAVIHFQLVASTPASIQDLETTCGALGVMKIDKNTLPQGVDPDHVRKCLNHPESLLRERSEGQVFKRECWNGANG
ncbi:hypothetical protein ED733_007480 [Metarhizium rileyi]|uniref:Uncharacterized protein n=1 Tax=Metarhizium rileyi (strain RCEF 4871) TaxID=1649241 RepID=A0A5C6GMN9_METRR|nr:hypothetical protein ED733_007480 [Metarhizium rileyi]